MMTSMGQRIPTNRTGSPSKRRAQSARISVVVADIDHDVEPGSTVGGDRFVPRREERSHERRSRVVRLTGTQPDTRLVLRRGRLTRLVDAEIHPLSVERLLDHGDDARLPGSRRSVQDDDLPRVYQLALVVHQSATLKQPRKRPDAV